jgi:hypothetical protein
MLIKNGVVCQTRVSSLELIGKKKKKKTELRQKKSLCEKIIDCQECISIKKNKRGKKKRQARANTSHRSEKRKKTTQNHKKKKPCENGICSKERKKKRRIKQFKKRTD